MPRKLYIPDLPEPHNPDEIWKQHYGRDAWWSLGADAPSRFIYFIRIPLLAGDPLLGSLRKIGVAKDPGARLATLQTGSPFDLEITTVAPGTLPGEKGIHTSLRDERFRKEWFAGPKTLEMEQRVKGFSEAAYARYETTGRVCEIHDRPPFKDGDPNFDPDHIVIGQR